MGCCPTSQNGSDRPIGSDLNEKYRDTVVQDVPSVTPYKSSPKSTRYPLGEGGAAGKKASTP